MRESAADAAAASASAAAAAATAALDDSARAFEVVGSSKVRSADDSGKPVDADAAADGIALAGVPLPLAPSSEMLPSAAESISKACERSGESPTLGIAESVTPADVLGDAAAIVVVDLDTTPA